MNDPELRQLVKKFLIIVTITLIFIVPSFFIFYNKILIHKNTILNDLNKNKTIIIYITEDNCKKCNTIIKDFKNNKKIKELKTNDRDYDEIIRKIKINEDAIVPPTVIYIKKGKLVSYIVNVNSKKELKEFLNNNI